MSGGRLGEYQYYNMDVVIAKALELVKFRLFSGGIEYGAGFRK